MPQDTRQDSRVTAARDQVLEAIRTTQEATVNVWRTWAQTFASVTPSMFDVLVTPKDSFSGFAEKLWGNQRDFFVSLSEVASDIGRAMPETARRSAAAADTARSAAKS